MKKNIGIIASLIMVFVFAFQCQALGAEIENTVIKYPNYSSEFVGKDVFESFNRKVFLINLKINKYSMRFLSVAWASVLPQSGIEKIQNFYSNIKYPIRLTSCLLQKDFDASKTETQRFLINSSMGIFGLNDPATTKFNIESHQEDIGQALAKLNVKSGPYLVLPMQVPGTIRDIAGNTVGSFLNPASYITGPLSTASSRVSSLNSKVYLQPMAQMAENFADPYEVAKQMYGLDKYIKISNLDRRVVLASKEALYASENLEDSETSMLSPINNIKPDIDLLAYSPQSPLIDSLRTMKFDNQKIDNSKWGELSIWNKNFSKQIKSSSIKIMTKHPKYKYRYVLQENKSAPLAIIYPSIGEGVMSSESILQAKILYDNGYSVLIMGNPFQWEFVKSMPDGYHPGLPYQDAFYIRKVTSMALSDLHGKGFSGFSKKIVVGTSFGATVGLFVAAQEQEDNTLEISNYIAINPPIDMFFALNQLDKCSSEANSGEGDVKMKAAVTAQKVIMDSQIPAEKKETLSLSELEAKTAISYALKQKLSDVVFTIEHGSTISKNIDLYEKINNMSFYNYAQIYLIPTQSKSLKIISYESSLYSLSDYLSKNNNYKIYHSVDDFFTSQDQLAWLKKQTQNKSVLFSNGSHLGYLYRKEFLDEFTRDINLKIGL